MAARSIIFDSPYSWRELYIAAVIETVNKRLPERIRAAEEAIAFRLISLMGCEEDDEDLQEIKATLEALEVLKHERRPKQHKSGPNYWAST